MEMIRYAFIVLDFWLDLAIAERTVEIYWSLDISGQVKSISKALM